MNRRTFVTSAVAGVVGAVTSAVAGEHVRGQFLPPCVPPVSPEYVIPHLHLELLNAPMRRVARWKRIRSLDGQSYLGVHRDTGYVVTFDRRTCIPGSEWWEQSIGTHLPPPPFDVWFDLRNTATGGYLIARVPAPRAALTLMADGDRSVDAVSFRASRLPRGWLFEHRGDYLRHVTGNVELVHPTHFPVPPVTATAFDFYN